MPDPSAIVVGGGLAGMVVARELALRHWRVIVLERSKRLGGKAGSDIKNGRLLCAYRCGFVRCFAQCCANISGHNRHPFLRSLRRG
jgi:oxygen-dependent protoporphyrinogen oxidase